MKIKELLKNMPYAIIQGSDNLDIEAICWDSRRVEPKSIFICTKGKNIDRHNFASDAIKKGSIALLVEDDIPNIPREITVIKVMNTRIAMAYAANLFYHEPSKELNLIGVTGTNGKTSITYFLEETFKHLGRKVGLIGTIENRIGNEVLSAPKLNPTTPDAIELQCSLREMLEKGASDAVMEVTSSALDNHRVDYSDFHIGIFTNLTQDHLDEHGTMENYKKAKMKLFSMCRLSIINADDEFSHEIIKNTQDEVITYGINNPSDFMAKDIEYTSRGTNFILVSHGSEKKVKLNTLGSFNVYNSLAAAAACYFMGYPLQTIIDGLAEVKGIPGRFEFVANPKHLNVIVDYAHTPDSLKNILVSTREISKGKIILVFGCGGNRDTSKRPIMGKIAGGLSDYCIITSDNPRFEEPLEIIADIENGLKETCCNYRVIEDRKSAIFSALSMASPYDTVIIAGKGHEDYQIIGKEIIHFNDIETVQEYFKSAK